MPSPTPTVAPRAYTGGMKRLGRWLYRLVPHGYVLLALAAVGSLVTGGEMIGFAAANWSHRWAPWLMLDAVLFAAAACL
jgi:hypothetical protein